MKRVLLVILGFFGFFAALFLIAAAFGIVDIGLIKTLGVAREDARREVFEQTRSFTQGRAQRLTNLCTEVATAADKRLLNGVIVHEFADTDRNDVPVHLRPCLDGARAGI